MQRHSMQEVIKAWFYYFMHGLGACLACYVRDGVQGGSSKQSQGKVTKKKEKRHHIETNHIMDVI